jgi:hypothetical protein
MKNIKIALSVLCPLLFSFASCEKDDNGTGKSTLEVSQSVEGKIILTTPLNATQTVKEAETGVYEYEIELNKSQPVDVHIHISKLNGTADEDEDFKFDHLIVIPAYSKAGKGKIEILNDAISESQEDFTLQIGDIKTSNAFITPSIIKFSIKDCFSNLAGTYAYVTSNCYTPGPPAGNATGPFTGNVTFTATATSGEYTISDASFGGWLGLYGTQTNPVNNTANGVKLLDLCGKISYSGKDQYDEIFTFSNLVITGNKMKFHWENDYGEKGDTELTNPNGNWPALTL